MNSYLRILLFAILFPFSPVTYAQSWQADSSFGVNGRCFFPQVTVGNAVARITSLVQPDGKLVLAANGRDQLTLQAGFATVRFTATGQPDPSFGDNGRVVTTVTPYPQQATKVVLQKDNKIIVGGPAVQGNNEQAFALVRYLPDGQADLTFGTNGTAIYNFKNGEEENLQGMSLQQDGRILACGYTFEAVSEIVVARYTTTGQPDTSFNGTGFLFLSLTPSSYQAANTILELPDGKILVGGVYRYPLDNGTYMSVLLRLHRNGRIDSSFGANGQIMTPSSETFIDLNSRPDGKILALGYRSLVRYTKDGIPDPGFGNGNGEVVISATASLRSMQVLEDGSIMVTGVAGTDFQLFRLTKNGLLDRSFGNDGQLSFPVGDYRDRSYTLMQRANRLYIGGSAEIAPGGLSRFAVIKLKLPQQGTHPFFRVFPNPTPGELFIETDATIGTMALYNSLGQLVATWNNNERRLNLERFAAGVYVLRVRFSNGQSVQEKIVRAD